MAFLGQLDIRDIGDGLRHVSVIAGLVPLARCATHR